MEWIAERRVVFVLPGGERKTGRISIGAPTTNVDRCACQVALEGLERSVAIFGADTLQALLLASRFLGFRLHDFLQKGGRVVEEDSDDDVPLAATFGEFLRAAVTE